MAVTPTLGYVQVVGGTNVIGGAFEFRVVRPDGVTPYPTGTIVSTSWSIDHAYGPESKVGATFTKPQDYFQYSNFGTRSTIGDTVYGYWDGTPGTRNVSVSVTFSVPTIFGMNVVPYRPSSPIIATMNVAGVSKASLKPGPPGSTAIVQNADGSGFVTTDGKYTAAGDGMTLFASVSLPKGVKGTVGVIQTHDTYLRDTYKLPNGSTATQQGFLQDLYGGPILASPPTLLDVVASDKTPYYGFVTKNGSIPTVASGKTGRLQDSPSSPFTANTVNWIDENQFTDTLIVRPENGLAVPVGYLVWSVNMNLVRNAQGKMIEGPNWHTPQVDQSFQQYTGGEDAPLPAWDNKGPNFIPDKGQINWTQITQVSTGDLPPLPDGDPPWNLDAALTVVVKSAQPPPSTDTSDQIDDWSQSLPLPPAQSPPPPPRMPMTYFIDDGADPNADPYADMNP